MENQFFRKLNNFDESIFRKWARDNYIPGNEIPTVWHPVVRHECEEMNIEQINARAEDEENT